MKQVLTRLGYFLLSSAAHFEAPEVETSLLTHLQCPYPTEEMDRARRTEEKSPCQFAELGEKGKGNNCAIGVRNLEPRIICM
jgi:hypothetical protein